ncbi:hypothetical protein Mal4_50030 [Maioricimonas rarisocia]|uniref:Uncharacterized protein n=1 Tax=Maioricimonas rarisocia TaxID=2528026 RepID=A0A517ZDW1_9PLAN|nr:hypothetical protein [Maioricimonas rarisocia]QDU40645.1 hypothetical protein Mal4_50030 [Maioricimonas rarisocia]
MRHDWLWGVVVLVVCTCACQPESVAPAKTTASSEQLPAAATTTEGTDSRRTQIELGDLLEALDMQMWKARVNDDPGAVIRSMKLELKQRDAGPKELMSIEVPDGEPGTLLVYLQEQLGRKIKIGMVFTGDEGTGNRSSNVIDNPFTDVVVSGNTGANIGRPGTIVLRSTAGPGGDDVSRPESVAIYLENR